MKINFSPVSLIGSEERKKTFKWMQIDDAVNEKFEQKEKICKKWTF